MSGRPGRLARHVERAAAAVRAMPAFRAKCQHEWAYFEDAEHSYTGYLERCKRCGEIVQVPQ